MSSVVAVLGAGRAVVSKPTAADLIAILADVALDDLVAIAAAAIVAAERRSSFCLSCQRRIGVRHRCECPLGEPGDHVTRAEAADVEDLVARRVIEIRSEAR